MHFALRASSSLSSLHLPDYHNSAIFLLLFDSNKYLQFFLILVFDHHSHYNLKNIISYMQRKYHKRTRESNLNGYNIKDDTIKVQLARISYKIHVKKYEATMKTQQQYMKQ